MGKRRFENKTAIVTGAGKGIGFEMAKSLLEEGAKVILNDVEEALCEESARKLSEFGNCLAFPGDVATAADRKSVV